MKAGGVRTVPNPSIFREYDVRGRVGPDLDPEVALLLGRGFGTWLRSRGGRLAVVGRDNRLSSGPFAEAVRTGLRSAGVNVVDIGLTLTPVFYFAVRHYEADGGVMVTGSHNPPDENGFKLAYRDGTLWGPEIQEVRRLIEAGRFAAGRASVGFSNPTAAYLKAILERVSLGGARFRVAVDAGNGSASDLAPRLVELLGCEVVPLYCDSDPTFPNHFPDPVVPENLRDLAALVVEQACDLGVAYDGDADRLGVVDDLGRMVWGDGLMALFWREILARYPGAPALVEVKCSEALVEEVRRLGGRPVFCRTGHSLIKAKLKETGAPFAGEMSGHLFFADEYFGFDDALYATARLLRLLAGEGRPLSVLLDELPRYWASPETRVPCPDERKFAVVEELRGELEALYPCVTVDGVRAVFPDGWGLVRASNTQPALVLRCEGRTPEALERIKGELARLLDRFPEVGPVRWSA
ncbi:MAG: phosphomannomutase/phosphoglucomutase [Firmicutes bacterium]|nr:phosphomannomutase/phosphoglucomutase [Bacillota bacterium]